jgi:pSer/pThr/pTyr-binding forkhead associated (FHA) protein
MPVLLKPIQGGRPIVLDKPILLIGRHPDCDVILKNSAKISRKHCCVALVDNRFVVRDLDSMNGVWVNGNRVEHSAMLRNGDELMIGDIPFQVSRNGDQQDQKTPLPQKSTDTAEEIPAQAEQSLDDEAAKRAARAALKERRSPEEAGPADAVEFSSAFAIPLPEQDDDDFVIPIADSED